MNGIFNKTPNKEVTENIKELQRRMTLRKHNSICGRCLKNVYMDMFGERLGGNCSSACTSILNKLGLKIPGCISRSVGCLDFYDWFISIDLPTRFVRI